MPRPPLQIGSHGKIRTYKDGPTKWRAVTQIRLFDGKTRQVERSDTTETKAVKKLQTAIKELQSSKARLTRDSKFRDVADAWLAKVEKRRAATTHGTYQRTLNNLVLDRIGDLRIREISVAALADFFDELEEEEYSANYRRTVRTTIKGTLQIAIRHGLLDSNPVRELDAIEGGSRKVRALTAAERVRFLASVDQFAVESRYYRGSELPDLVRFLLGTGCRIGEALAVRWKDVNLTNKPVLVDGVEVPPRAVWINGNIVHVTGKGLVRHPGKSPNANRFIALPEFVLTVLTVRLLSVWCATDGAELGVDPNVVLQRLSSDGCLTLTSDGSVRIAAGFDPMALLVEDPIFPSRTLGWKSPNNVRRSLRVVREEIGFSWVTPHVCRKTAATILDDERLTPRQIADVLGHAKPSTTLDLYLGRGSVNEAAAAAIDAAFVSS